MKTIKIISRFILSVTAACCMASCNYLDVVPDETADLPDAMKDRASTLGFLHSCYTYFEWFYTVENSFINSTDEYARPLLWADDGQKAAWNQLSPSSQTAPWNSCYDGIGRCHLFMDQLDKSNPTGVTESDKRRWKAEALFCRALYHFMLLESYGPIPLVTEHYNQNLDKKDFPGRSHFDVCVDSIAEWFDRAAFELPPTVQNSELGRATSTACKALKARLLVYAASPLWNGSFPYSNWKNTNFETPGYGKELVSRTYDENKWERALTACNEALDWALTQGNRKLFDLATSTSIRINQGVPLPNIEGVDDQFKESVMLMRYLNTTRETDGNKEVIFAIGSGDNYGIYSQIPHGVTTYNGSPVGGWGGIAVFLNSVERFYTKNGKLPQYDHTFPDKSDWFESAGLSNPDIIKLNVNREPRFYAWVCYDGGEYSSFIADGSPLILEARNSQKHGYNPDRYNRDNNATGYFSKKRIQPNFQWRSQDNGNNYAHTPLAVIRLAELYLNLAECHAALNSKQDVLDNLNIVRNRAGIPDLELSDINSDMSLMDWVRSERYAELWFEGHRYFDARRWIIAPEVFKAGVREGLNAIAKKDPSFREFNQRVKVDQPFMWTNKMYLLPINDSEIYSNPQLVQSPEY